MSQRKAHIEARLEKLENWLGNTARTKKLLEILTVKVEHIQNPTIRDTALADIREAQQSLQRGQDAVRGVIIEYIEKAP